eukprot:scpid103941/ scgid0441/ 
MGNHQPTQWMEVGLSTTNTMDGSRAFDNQHNGWEQLFRQLTQWHDGSGFLETKRQHNDQVAPTLAMVSPSWLGFVTAAMSVDELYTSTAPGYWSRVTVSVDIRNTIHAGTTLQHVCMTKKDKEYIPVQHGSCSQYLEGIMAVVV